MGALKDLGNKLKAFTSAQGDDFDDELDDYPERESQQSERVPADSSIYDEPRGDGLLARTKKLIRPAERYAPAPVRAQQRDIEIIPIYGPQDLTHAVDLFVETGGCIIEVKSDVPDEEAKEMIPFLFGAAYVLEADVRQIGDVGRIYKIAYRAQEEPEQTPETSSAKSSAAKERVSLDDDFYDSDSDF
ncbi:MAG: hypothetical protein LBQ91_01520 [Oscillospiraceae bacterium]|jgi:FtsZ-interacting cell division protein YlmF|nr:hypothetical protein [Oscillospiraceae bacterium]